MMPKSTGRSFCQACQDANCPDQYLQQPERRECLVGLKGPAGCKFGDLFQHYSFNIDTFVAGGGILPLPRFSQYQVEESFI
jgi:hypothetical protein